MVDTQQLTSSPHKNGQRELEANSLGIELDSLGFLGQDHFSVVRLLGVRRNV